MLNNIQIKLNLHVLHLKTEYISSHFIQIWCTVRCGSKTQILVLWRSHITTEMVKVGVEKATSLLQMCFSESFLSITIGTDLFPAFLLIINFSCKIISNQIW